MARHIDHIGELGENGSIIQVKIKPKKNSKNNFGTLLVEKMH
jgi:hypothetical protein